MCKDQSKMGNTAQLAVLICLMLSCLLCVQNKKDQITKEKFMNCCSVIPVIPDVNVLEAKQRNGKVFFFRFEFPMEKRLSLRRQGRNGMAAFPCHVVPRLIR